LGVNVDETRGHEGDPEVAEINGVGRGQDRSFIMKRVTIGAAMFGVVAAAAIGLAGTASAAPLGGAPADQVVQTLTARGYDVQINGAPDAPLDRCTVTDVDGLTGDVAPGSTVYVDINCPSDYR
jgi:hypothetical protein